MKEIFDFLNKCGTYYLATVEDGKPRVRPFGTIDIYNGKLTIQTGMVKNVAKQMLKNPNIEICACNKDKWIRIEAVVEVDESEEATDHILERYPYLRNMYRPGDGNTCVFVLKSGVATINSFGTEPKVIKF